MKQLTPRILFTTVALVTLLGGMALTPTATAQTLLWSDEFDGTSVDTTKWTVYNKADGTDSWYLPGNVTVSNGTLRINSKEELTNGVHWTGGYIDTAPSGSEHPQYRYLEARCRVTPNDCYVWATWWTVGWVNQTLVWPPEFDIAEYQGAVGKDFGQYYHYNGGYVGCTAVADESAWHTYGVYWTATAAPVFYVDGVISCTPGGPVADAQYPMKLKLTSSPNSGTRFSGCPLGVFEVDYVRVYDLPPGAPLPPPAPTGLTATAASSSQINLSWAASSGATSYNVKRATVSGGPYTTIATGVTGTTYNDTGLAASTTYYYVVSAVNTGGESPNSAQASATTQAASLPPVPTGLTATAQKQPGRIKLSWTASSGATSYNAKRATVSGGPYTTIATGVTTTTYMDTGLTSGTTYYYVVSAVNGTGESPNSTQASATAK